VAVRADVAERARAAGRDPASVRLIAVGKTQPAAAIAAAHRAGLTDFGENYAQELRDKGAELAAVGLAWHFIGALQRNKAKYVVGLATLVHTVDSRALLEEIERLAARRGITQRVLVEVNVGGEAAKSGVAPGELPALLDALAAAPHVRCEGLMTIPPFGEAAESSRPYFAALRALRDAEAARTRPNVALDELSMGMSGDYGVAIEEGATLVRVGTAIFGERYGRSV
jgi:pyridoxal phosphate enzyme (YggS family)